MGEHGNLAHPPLSERVSKAEEYYREMHPVGGPWPPEPGTSGDLYLDRQMPEPKRAPIKIGDAVLLKSGSFPMTVINMQPSGNRYLCIWLHNSDLCVEWFGEEMLIPRFG